MIEALSKRFVEARLPAVSADTLVETSVLSAAIDALEGVAFERYDLADRGAYDTADTPAPPRVEAALTEIASTLARRSLEVHARRWYRMKAGDYTLVKDDRWAIAEPPGWIDLSLDLSLEPTEEAEVVFTHRGAPFFTVPQRLGAIGLVERGPTVGRFDRYLTHRVGDRVVARLRLLLVARDTRSA